MKILVFGASGHTGREIVKQAIAMEHQVKALVRNPQNLELFEDNLETVKGDVLEFNDVDKAMEGVKAVIVALGAKGDTSATVLTDGTRNIVECMEAHGVKRIIVMSSFGYSGSDQGMEFLHKVMTDEQIKAVQPMIDDKIGQERAVSESNLDWTIVRPVLLTDGAMTETYLEGDLEIQPGQKISRADVANFILKHLSDVKYSQKVVTIAYPHQ